MKSRQLFHSFAFLIVLITLLLSNVATSNSQASSLKAGSLQTYDNLNLLILIRASKRSNYTVGSDVGAKTKLEIIKESLQISLEQNPFPPNANIGVMAFGHKIDRTDYIKSCSEENVELLLPLQPASELGNLADLAIIGLGESPTGQALVEAGKLFTQTSPNTKNVILLIADGADSCNQNPVEEAKILADSKNVAIYTIGFLANPDDNKELQNIAKQTFGKYSFIPSYLNTNERTTEELTKAIAAVFTELIGQIIPMTFTPTNTPESSETVTITPKATDTKSSLATTESPTQKISELTPEPTLTVEPPSTPIGTIGILFVSAVIILGALAFGFWYWRSRKITKIVDQTTEAESLAKTDDRLEDFWNDLREAYASTRTRKYIPLEFLKQKLSSKYAQEQFDELLIQARRKYPNKIWIEKDSKGQTLVKINV